MKLSIRLILLAALLSACGRPPLPEAAAARVGDAVISRARYEQALAAFAKDAKEPPSPEDRRRVLDLLIDEELLLRYGVTHGAVDHDPRVRNAVVTSVMESQKNFACESGCTDANLRAFFEKNQTAFAQPARYGVETVFVSGAEARDAAAALAEKWRAGTKPDGAPDPSAPPAVLLPLSKIADYLGAGAAGVVSAMEEGGVSEPVAAPGGWRVLRVVRREPERVPSFGEVRPLVKAELIRRANERAIESLLAGLRSESSIAIANDLR